MNRGDRMKKKNTHLNVGGRGFRGVQGIAQVAQQDDVVHLFCCCC